MTRLSAGPVRRQAKGDSLPPREVVRESVSAALEQLQGPEHRGRAGSAAAEKGLVRSAVARGRAVTEAEHAALVADLLQEARKALDEQPPDPITVAGFVNNDVLNFLNTAIAAAAAIVSAKALA